MLELDASPGRILYPVHVEINGPWLPACRLARGNVFFGEDITSTVRIYALSGVAANRIIWPQLDSRQCAVSTTVGCPCGSTVLIKAEGPIIDALTEAIRCSPPVTGMEPGLLAISFIGRLLRSANALPA